MRARLIPVLTMLNGQLYKTTKFKNPVYVGDPLNAVRIFNESEADELCLLDMGATGSGSINFELIAKVAYECQMPLTYGGGLGSLEASLRAISLGVEKICFGSLAVTDPALIYDVSHRIGAQSVAVVLDVFRDSSGTYKLSTQSNTVQSDVSLEDWLLGFDIKAIGDLLINNVDRDGTGAGFDLDLVRSIKQLVGIPITFIGGAGSLDDCRKVVEMFEYVGLGIGSLFCFKGKFRAVLINYPDKAGREFVYYGAPKS